MFKLSERTMLVQLNVSQWAARKLDKQETEALNRHHGSQTEAARVNKSLLPTALSLDAIHKKTGAIRTDYYFNTLPWAMDGARIIKAAAYMDFTLRMRQQINEWERLVDVFVAEYPQLVEDAKTALNGMFKAADYPHPFDIRAKFSTDVGFMPMPDAADWRIDVADEELAYLKDRVTKQVTEGVAVAAQEAWKRVHDVVSSARERLKDPKNVFRDSLVENAKALCQVLPMLNINDDPKLEAVRQEIEGSLCQWSPDVLREDTTVRLAVSDKMADIMARMGGMYGNQAAA